MSENNKSFIEQNKSSIIDELVVNVNRISALLSETLPHELKKSKKSIPPNVSEVYTDLSMATGYVVALLSELVVLENGLVIKEQEEPVIGFRSMIDRSKK
jgi:hypothetical protein